MGKKATFILDEQIFEEAKQMVKSGFAKSLSFFVEIALREKLDKIKKEKIRQQILEAGRDPLFLADIRKVEQDFQSVDFEVEPK